MKKIKLSTIVVVFFSLCLFSVQSCNKKNTDTMPVCMNDKIAEWEKVDCSASGANIEEYYFQNKIVFVFNSYICGSDFPSTVVDNNCNEIGYLGGYVGNGMINGVDFYKNAIYIKEMWRN